MKQLFFLALLLVFINGSHAQNVGIGTNTPNVSAQLDITSTTRGLLIPRMTSAERIAITTPATGLMLYETTTNTFWFYNGAAWNQLGTGGTSQWLVSGQNLYNGNTGNTGIGTSAPSSKLHLVGSLLQESGSVTLNNPVSIIQFQNAGVNKIFMQLSGDNLRIGTNSGNQLGKTIFRMAGQDRVLIDSTGNMLILGLQDASLNSNGYITLGSITGRNMILDNNEIMVRSNGSTDNLILQNEGGNVGIGVASPTAKLHVNGDVIVANTGASLQLRDGSNINTGYFQLSGDNVRLGTNSGNATGNLVFRMNGNDRITINPTGDMDIDGQIRRTAVTGNAKLLPVCMGEIDGQTGAIINGTGNFTVARTVVFGQRNYEITSPAINSTSMIFLTPRNHALLDLALDGYYSSGNTMRAEFNYSVSFYFIIYTLQ